MKSATFPSLRVDPDLRQAAEEVLADGESLSSFVEQSIRTNVERRQAHRAFIARGLAGKEDARRTGAYLDADGMLEKLKERLDLARPRA